jgi:hypothetical protein
MTYKIILSKTDADGKEHYTTREFDEKPFNLLSCHHDFWERTMSRMLETLNRDPKGVRIPNAEVTFGESGSCVGFGVFNFKEETKCR